MAIINLTQHLPSPEQIEAGVVEPVNKSAVSGLLTFEEPPTRGEMARRAEELADIASAAGVEAAMIGGAPFFMSALEAALKVVGVRALHAFTRREAADVPQADGSVRKTQVFRHVGWVEV